MWVSNLNNRHAVSLRRLLPSASFVGCADIHVTSVSANSAECQDGCLFAAIPGAKVDGQSFVQEAISQGANALLSQQPQSNVSIPQCIVPQVRAAYATLCHALYGMPSRKLKTVGVTGTNGKSTTAYLIRSILAADNQPTGLLGTIEYHDTKLSETSSLTTPDPSTFADWLHRMVRNHATHAVFELSSHAMHQQRAAGVELDVAVLTNITHDHLDYHQTFEDYKQSKAKIFNHCKPNASVIVNGDDEQVKSIEHTIPSHLNVISYSSSQPANCRASRIQISLSGTHFLLHIGHESVPVATNLIGLHNVENCLAAAAASYQLGVSPEIIAKGIKQLQDVPGRLEAIHADQNYNIFVDYAHTDDAIERCLHTLRKLTKGRLICVFGAGGDRDRTKRPKFAKATHEADIAIVTSDNPRTEDPERIIDDILEGFHDSTINVHVEPDRRRAIQLAISIAQPEDTILVAGKGHETHQVIGEVHHAFDDRDVIRECFTPTNFRISA